MLRSTFYSFTTALRGLNTAQKQLDVTGQNISNISTTGYTRQRADTYASSAAGYGDKYASIINSSLVGQGSVVGGISQIRDPFLDVRFRRESSAVGEQDAKAACMEDMELIFDEIESSGLMTSFSNLISKLQSFSGNANSSEFDSIVRDAASTLVNQLRQYASQLSTVREEQEYQLKEVTVNKVNDLLTNIANINESIRSQEVAGGSALELKDERNLLLDELSSYVKLDVTYKKSDLPNGSSVNDIYVSMIGADGSKTQLVYNNAAAKFSAALPGEKDASGNTLQEAVVTIDNSDIQAKTILDKVNQAISSISTINNQLATIFTAHGTDTDSYAADLTTAKSALVTNQALYDAETDPAIKKTLGQTIAGLKTKISDLEKADKLLTNRIASEAVLTDAFGSNVHIENSTDTNFDGNIDIKDYSITLLNTDSTTQSLVSQSAGTKLTKADLINAGTTFTSTTANKVQSQGALKGTLDMLNSKGTFDYNNNEVRGIGYYEEMLNSLANQFASKLNLLNSMYTTTDGGYANITDSRPLFETSDGSDTITASNIKIANDWLTGKYGITATKQTTTDGSTGANDNILLMISAFSSKYNYKTSTIVAQDANGNYLNQSGDIFANGRDSDGNYTLNGTKVADKNLIDYDTSTGLLKANVLTITDNGDGTYSTGGAVFANGRDSAGNYTLKLVDSEGNLLDADGNITGSIDPSTDITKNGDGTYTYGGQTLTKDSQGNYVVKVANEKAIAYEADGKTLDATSSLKARTNGFLYNGTFQEFLTNISNVLSLDVSSTSNLLANHTTVLSDIQNSRDALSSVSIDEEGINMMQYQKAYNAAARLMTTLDEAVGKIIEMGVVGR
ncbi:FlgK family flagellar hook-associated protein [Clostridium aminobutyricum]|uniref:Flagellar hook-associated protein 1 n=1 Tax=Clostridium aminobutyricum TaxID=33953 RepID=A0A939D954_CLOAM|nr:flagellar basal body protein [Clostridium aminobutyricum]MBN7773739.1 hypothetical protein [Clostridium aminobutyricum]